MRSKLPIALALTIAALASLPLAASGAISSEPTRTEYKSAVEPICAKNTKANERILKGVQGRIRHGQLKPAALQFEKATKALRATLAELKAVPRPTADQARLSKWFVDIGAELKLFGETTRLLHAGNKVAAERAATRLTPAADKANNDVIGFEFQYCHAEPSRFT